MTGRPYPAFYGDRLCVHADIKRPQGEAEQDEKQGQGGQAAGQAEQDRASPGGQDGPPRCGRARPTVDEAWRDAHREQLSNRSAEQSNPKLGVTQVQFALDHGNPRHPSRQQRAEHEEDGRGTYARPLERRQAPSDHASPPPVLTAPSTAPSRAPR